jgi:hypothetical protein
MAKEQKATETKRLAFAMERISVLEQLVAGLARKAGAFEPQIAQWRQYSANWPQVDGSLTKDARPLME